MVGIKVHSGWQWAAGAPQQPVDDIAMLKLDHSVNVQPIQLAGQAARPGDRVTLYGWGADQPDGDTSNLPRRLQQLRTTVLTPERCADAGQSAGEICTDNPHGTDGPGGGDSGGPAVAVVDGVPQLVGTCSRAAAQYPASHRPSTPVRRTSGRGSTTQPEERPPRNRAALPSGPRRHQPGGPDGTFRT